MYGACQTACPQHVTCWASVLPAAAQVFFISLFLAIFAYKKHQPWHWVAVGLLVDFCLRFYVSVCAHCTDPHI